MLPLPSSVEVHSVRTPSAAGWRGAESRHSLPATLTSDAASRMKPVMQRGQATGVAAVEPAPETLLRLDRIVKSFGDNLVLDGIDLEVASGEVLVVIGPSGSGKSTLLRCVNLLEPLDSGSIVFEGAEITGKGTDVSRVRQRIGMVFQQFNLFPHLTVLDNLTLAARTNPQARPRARRRRGRTSCWRRSGSRRRRTSTRTSSRAASSSGLRSHAR